jgi:hypothetical protein
MGKTAKPVTILVMDRALLESTEVQALRTKGHTVAYCEDNIYDVIIGPQCWRIEPGLGDLEVLLEMVLKGVRAKKRGVK